ncbi:MAG TPA: hypothetical protein VH951_05530, partial [Dehalococcoidia bacterium]
VVQMDDKSLPEGQRYWSSVQGNGDAGTVTIDGVNGGTIDATIGSRTDPAEHIRGSWKCTGPGL